MAAPDGQAERAAQPTRAETCLYGGSPYSVGSKLNGHTCGYISRGGSPTWTQERDQTVPSLTP
jgi:hypothetical protein